MSAFTDITNYLNLERGIAKNQEVLMLKQGQTINIGGRGGTVTYLIGHNEAVVTLDDDVQVQSLLDEINVPATLRAGWQLRNWRDVPAELVDEARARYDAGELNVKISSWLREKGYDVQAHHLNMIVGRPDENEYDPVCRPRH